MNSYFLSFAVLVISAISSANGHGRLLEPPSRASMFRFENSDPMLIPHRGIIQPNYDDNQLYCGGRERQLANGGKCGACGDPFDGAREHEAGGQYAKGIITRNYQEGQVIDATVQITAAHKGYFEFRLCPWNQITNQVTTECLNKNLLRYEDGETKSYLDKEGPKFYQLRIRLPSNLTCSQCVLQWRYRTGNSWGVDDEGMGLGHGQQEEFYGCADVAIFAAGSSPSSSVSATSTTIRKTTQSTSGSMAKPNPTTTTLNPDIDGPQGIVDCSEVVLGQPIFRDCSSFYVCAYSFQRPFVKQCPSGTVCDPNDGRCKHLFDVPACSER